MTPVAPLEGSPLAVLARVRRAGARTAQEERCDLCAAPLGEEHRHLVDVDTRSLRCACRACALLFEHGGAGRYRAVPEEYLALEDFELPRERWEALQVPVGIVFFFTNSRLGRVVAFYPSPAGATECELDLAAWEGFAAGHPALGDLLPDVQAVLLRVEGDCAECFVVPIDACYELVGHLRQVWRGFDGGADAHRRVDEFFATLRARCRPAERGSGRA